jgi:hypothetical protein
MLDKSKLPNEKLFVKYRVQNVYLNINMQSIRLKEKTFWYHLRQYLREYGQISNIHGVHYLTEKRTRSEK